MLREFKKIPLELKENATSYSFEGYASTFGNIDLGGDVVVSGAFTKSLQQDPSVPILWQHEMDEPLGRSTTLKQDDHGLFIKYDLPKEDTFVSGRVMPQVKAGSVREMSIGFWINDYEFDAKNGVRYLKDISLFEVSLVTKAMNPQAVITAFKSMGSLGDIESYLKMYGFSNAEAKTLISRVKDFSGQRDVESKGQRDVDPVVVSKMLSGLSEAKNIFTNQPKLIF